MCEKADGFRPFATRQTLCPVKSKMDSKSSAQSVILGFPKTSFKKYILRDKPKTSAR